MIILQHLKFQIEFQTKIFTNFKLLKKKGDSKLKILTNSDTNMQFNFKMEFFNIIV